MKQTAPVSAFKDKSDDYVYVFTGWDKDFSEVTEDLNVYAVL